jgi:hypothetical protein
MFEKLKGMLRYSLFIFYSNNVEKEKRYKRLVKRLFEGLKKNLEALRVIVEDVIKLGNQTYSMNDLHCYDYEPVKKRCSISVLLSGTKGRRLNRDLGKRGLFRNISKW